MPRYGDVAQLRWFRGPKGVSCYHMMNAWEDEAGLLHFDQCLSNTNAFAFILAAIFLASIVNGLILLGVPGDAQRILSWQARTPVFTIIWYWSQIGIPYLSDCR